MLFIDVEGGTTTIRRKKDIDVVSLRSIKQLESVYDELRTANEGYYKTCVIDSLTELQKLNMRVIMKETPAVLEGRQDPDVPSMREWGKSGEHIRRIVRGFRDLEMNVIMTALVDVDKDENGVVRFRPSLPGKLKMEVPGFMDVVGFYSAVMEQDTLIRRLQFAATRRVIAKDRTGNLGDMVDNPTFPDLWDKMQKGESSK